MSLNHSPIERAVAAEVAKLTPNPAREIVLTLSAEDHGVDSLALLVLRESIETRFSLTIPDLEWTGFDSLADLVGYLERTSADAAVASAEPDRAPTRATVGGARASLTSDGTFEDIVEVGMPMTGLNGLAENPLLKYLGHLRWSHLSAVCGVPSRSVVDAEGHRLYPTFFYVDLQFPPLRDMATFGENDRIQVVSTLRRFGASMLDGIALMLPEGSSARGSGQFRTVREAVDAGIPAARLSNIFVKQFGGAQWLKKSRPSNPGFERITEALEAPDSYAITKTAEREGTFESAPQGYTPLTDGFVTLEYSLIPDRDLNGAGLVYFANYPLFVDICERAALKACTLAFTDQLLDRRSLERRRSAYLNNASSQDVLSIEIQPWLRTHTPQGQPESPDNPARLLVNSRMRRKSDGRLMMVSCAEKVLSGLHLGDLPRTETSFHGRS